jgi:tripartite-type tricarboxylate transporter receptor subunit TctC
MCGSAEGTMTFQHRRRFLHLAAGAAVLPLMSQKASAQAYPARPVHLILGLAAGGPTDVAARALAEWLSQQLGQQFVVENRTGVGGNLANQAVFGAPPDGYTLLFAGPTTTIGAVLYKKQPFNVLKDAAPIATMMRFPNVMVVPPSLPVKTVQEFIDYARSHPGQLSLASSGVGASPHLSGELLKFMAGIDLVHVPYRGSSAAYPDLMTGKVHVFFDNLSAPVLELIRAGKLRALGVTSADRWAATPDIPTIAETLPGYEVIIWYGVLAPKNTPAEILAVLGKTINAALADPKMLARIAEGGGVPMLTTPAEFDKFIRSDIEKWQKVVDFAKISVE